MSWINTYHERAKRIARLPVSFPAHTREWNALEDDIQKLAPWQLEQLFELAERSQDQGAWVICAMLPLTGDPTTDMLT